jgi:hypothetical protein
MKNSIYLIALFLLAAVYSAQAQSPVVFKYKNNPTYSIQNYKQPTNIELAKKYNLDNVLTLNYIPEVAASDKASRNYKAQTVGTQKQVSGAVVPVAPKKKQVNSVHSPANYKRQFK